MFCLSMEEFASLPSKKPLIVVLGNFDGVHTGHRALLSAAMKQKQKYGLPVAVWTFETLPDRAVLTPPLLRAGWLSEFGADFILFDRFERVRNLSPEVFVSSILSETLHARVCICGFNHRFGKNGAGDAALLSRLCEERQISCVEVGEVTAPLDGETVTVSSTLIRCLIEEGRLTEANALLSHPYATCGEVIHGQQFGRTVGMPTVNQLPEEKAALLPRGVYATFCRIDDRYYPSVTNIGCRPTVCQDPQTVIETHILGYSGDLYGKNIPVGYLRYLRGEKKFDSAEELRAAVGRNMEEAQHCFTENADRLTLPSVEKDSLSNGIRIWKNE